MWDILPIYVQKLINEYFAYIVYVYVQKLIIEYNSSESRIRGFKVEDK